MNIWFMGEKSVELKPEFRGTLSQQGRDCSGDIPGVVTLSLATQSSSSSLGFVLALTLNWSIFQALRTPQDQMQPLLCPRTEQRFLLLLQTETER